MLGTYSVILYTSSAVVAFVQFRIKYSVLFDLFVNTSFNNSDSMCKRLYIGTMIKTDLTPETILHLVYVK